MLTYRSVTHLNGIIYFKRLQASNSFDSSLYLIVNRSVHQPLINTIWMFVMVIIMVLVDGVEHSRTFPQIPFFKFLFRINLQKVSPFSSVQTGSRTLSSEDSVTKCFRSVETWVLELIFSYSWENVEFCRSVKYTTWGNDKTWTFTYII